MKTLVVFYSRTGCTRKAAIDLAKLIEADVEELKERTNRHGLIGFLVAGFDALLGRPADLLPVVHKPETYDIVIVASPVWAFTLCPAMRAWLRREAANIRHVVFLCTQGGHGAERAMLHMRAIIGRDPLTTLVLHDRAIQTGDCAASLEACASEVLAYSAG